MFDNVSTKPSPPSAQPGQDPAEGEIKTMPMEYYLGAKTGTSSLGAGEARKPVTAQSKPKNKPVIWAVGVAVIAILGLSGYLLYLSYRPAETTSRPATTAPVVKPTVKPATVVDPVPTTPQPATVASLVTATESLDLAPATASFNFDPTKLSKFSLDLVATVDSDRDGLTDEEEVALGTNPLLLDTDKDGYIDGEEVKNFFSPLDLGTVKLGDSAGMKKFVNDLYGYEFLYPASFVATPMDTADPREVMVASAQNEFFYLLLDEKNPAETLAQWYQTKAPNVTGTLTTYLTRAGVEVMESPDGFTVYFARGSRVFIVNYNIGLAEQAKFPALFSVLINSFTFLTEAPVAALPETPVATNSLTPAEIQN